MGRPSRHCASVALQVLHDAGDATRRGHHRRAERHTLEAGALNRAASWLADLTPRPPVRHAPSNVLPLRKNSQN